jgi:hypothetical protein
VLLNDVGRERASASIYHSLLPCMLSCPILSYLILSYRTLPFRVLSHPILSYPTLPYRILSHLILSHPIPSYPIPSYPIPSCPILSYPVPSYPVPSYPVPSYPILSHPALSYPVVSYPILCGHERIAFDALLSSCDLGRMVLRLNKTRQYKTRPEHSRGKAWDGGWGGRRRVVERKRKDMGDLPFIPYLSYPEHSQRCQHRSQSALVRSDLSNNPTSSHS